MSHPFAALRRVGDLDLWESELHIDIFGSPGKLSVNADDAGPSEQQRRTFDEFIGTQHSLKQKVYHAILNYYLGVVDDCRERFSQDALHLAPRISNVEEMRGLLRAPYVVHIDDVRPNEIGLLCECTWEVEHGLGVRIADREIVEVGFQDICL